MLAHARVMFGIGADWVRPLTRDLLRDLLLTGATGFLGAHLLADLLGGAADRIALPCAPRAARRLLAAEG